LCEPINETRFLREISQTSGKPYFIRVSEGSVSFVHLTRVGAPDTISVVGSPADLNERLVVMSMQFEVINESEMQFISRGRKSTVAPELVEQIKKLAKGKAIAVTSMKVTAKGNEAKTERARYGAQIRAAAKQAGRKVTIRWSVAGVPQIVVTN
jgi:hypothetical protein